MSMDIVFVVDITGSTQNTLEGTKRYIIETFEDSVKSSNNPENCRIGFVGYRDKIDMAEDEYVVHPLTTDVMAVRQCIKYTESTGGGDYAEDWAGGIELALSLNWNDASKKMIVLITDAPAHGILFYEEDSYPDEEVRLKNDIETLIKQGISVSLVGVSTQYPLTNCMKNFMNYYDEHVKLLNTNKKPICTVKCINPNLMGTQDKTTNLIGHVVKSQVLSAMTSVTNDTLLTPEEKFSIEYDRCSSPPAPRYSSPPLMGSSSTKPSLLIESKPTKSKPPSFSVSWSPFKPGYTETLQPSPTTSSLANTSSSSSAFRSSPLFNKSLDEESSSSSSTNSSESSSSSIPPPKFNRHLWTPYDDIFSQPSPNPESMFRTLVNTTPPFEDTYQSFINSNPDAPSSVPTFSPL